MDFEKTVVNPELEDDDRQRVVQIMNNTKSQFVKDGSRELVASTNGVPALDDETIGYSRRKWRLKKKWYAKGKRWFYGLQYKCFDMFGLDFWKYITQGMTKDIKINDEAMRSDAWYAIKLAEGDPTFEGYVVWFKEQELATAFIEVIEAHRRETLLNEYLQLHPENIYL